MKRRIKEVSLLIKTRERRNIIMGKYSFFIII